MRACTHPVCCTCLGGNPLHVSRQQLNMQKSKLDGSDASRPGTHRTRSALQQTRQVVSICDLRAFLPISSHATHEHNSLARAAGASVTFRDPSGFVMPCSRVENRDSHPAVHFHLAAALRGVWITEALPHTPVSGRAMATTCRQHADVQIDAIHSTARGGESA